MQSPTQLKADLLALANMQIKRKDDDECIKLDNPTAYADAILIQFGLPDKRIYKEMLYFKHLPTDIELETKIEQLHKAAKDYLLSENKSEIKMMEDAVELQSLSFDLYTEL